MPANLPKDILKLAAELLKHQAKKQLGDEFIGALSKQLVDYAGDNVVEKISSFLDVGENAEKLIVAFQDADKAFYDQGDDTFKQMIISKPLGQIESLEKLARDLPNTLDDDGLLEALRHQIETDWSNLSPDVHIRAARVYRIYLERSLAIRCNQMLPSIFVKVERIETNTENLLAGQKVILNEIRKRSSAKDTIQPSFIVPFPRNEKFVGREDDLQKLHEALMKGETVGVRPAMLSGMGGIGKTQLAVQYAYQFKEIYSGGVYWVNAAQNWTTELVHLAEGIGLSSDEESENQRNTQLINAFIHFVNETPNILVIFDNVEDPKQLNQPLGNLIPSELPHLLFTTRRRDSDLPFESIDVRVLPEEIALKLLLDSKTRRPLLERADNDREKYAARMICKELGGLPLALALASAFLGKYPSIKLEDYRQRLNDEGLRAVDESGEDPIDLPTRHDKAVAATLKSQWDVLRNETAKTVLCTASIVGEAVQVSRALLRLLLRLPDEIKPGYPDVLDIALYELANLSLVEELTEDSLRLHPLVHKFVLQTIPDHEAFAHKAASNVVDSLQDISRLKREISHRGISALIADLRNGHDLFHLNQSIIELAILLDIEAPDLRRWDTRELPGFLSQQLYNRAFTRNSQNWQTALLRDLNANKVPWMQKRFSSSRVSLAFLRLFKGHSRWVYSVAVTPDGKYAVSGSEDHTLRLWDLNTGESLRTFKGHTSIVTSVAVTPDGKYAISGSWDNTLCLWDLNTGESLRSFDGHTHKVYSVAVTPDGKYAVSGSYDETLRLWDLNTGESLRTFKGHTSPVYSVVITPDGKNAISASVDKTLRLWDLNTGESLRTFRHTNDVKSVAVTPDGKYAISSSYATLCLWDLNSGELLRSFNGHKYQIKSVAVTPDGKYAVSGSEDDTLRLWDLNIGELLRTFEGHTSWVESVAVTPDGKYAISASRDATLRLWDLNSEEPLPSFEGHKKPVFSVAVTPDGKYAVSGSEDYTLRLWDLNTGKLLQTFEGHTSPVYSVAVTPDGRHVFSASSDKTFRLWELNTGELLRTFEEEHVTSVAAITPDGKYAVSGYNEIVAAWDVSVTKGKLCLWDLNTGELLRTFESHTSEVTSVAITPDGKYAISASYDDTFLRLWDLITGMSLRTFIGHTSNVTNVAVTSDGKYAVSGSYDETLRLWDLNTGESLRTFKGHTSPVYSVVITPDGKNAISASSDATLRLWDLENGKCVLLLSSDVLFSIVAISPDGKTIVAGDALGAVHFIEMHNIMF